MEVCRPGLYPFAVHSTFYRRLFHAGHLDADALEATQLLNQPLCQTHSRVEADDACLRAGKDRQVHGRSVAAGDDVRAPYDGDLLLEGQCLGVNDLEAGRLGQLFDLGLVVRASLLALQQRSAEIDPLAARPGCAP